MPYFAYVTEATVRRVERIERYVMQDDEGHEVEALGQEFLAALYPGTDPGDFVQCWYPSGQPTPYPRGCYPATGYGWNGSEFISVEAEQ